MYVTYNQLLPIIQKIFVNFLQFAYCKMDIYLLYYSQEGGTVQWKVKAIAQNKGRCHIDLNGYDITGPTVV